MNKTLWIADLDGTLLRSDATLGPDSMRMLNTLIDRGVAISIATARTPATVFAILRGLRLQAPMVMMSGALVYDPADQEYKRTEEIELAAAGRLYEIMRDFKLDGFVYTMRDGSLSVFYETLEPPQLYQFYEERVRLYNKPFTPITSFSDIPQGPLLISIRDREERLRPAFEVMREFDEIQISLYEDVYLKGYWYLELSSREASKCKGVDYIRRQYGYSRIIGFGDNLIDLSLFEGCDAGYAVRNAREELKRAAAGVIGSNDEDGVARWIWEHAEMEGSNCRRGPY